MLNQTRAKPARMIVEEMVAEAVKIIDDLSRAYLRT
jgi:hypothetical protein